MKQRWKMARIGCGTPAVPLKSLLNPLFKALRCKDLKKKKTVILCVGYPLMGETAKVYVCMNYYYYKPDCNSNWRAASYTSEGASRVSSPERKMKRKEREKYKSMQ